MTLCPFQKEVVPFTAVAGMFPIFFQTKRLFNFKKHAIFDKIEGGCGLFKEGEYSKGALDYTQALFRKYLKRLG